VGLWRSRWSLWAVWGASGLVLWPAVQVAGRLWAGSRPDYLAMIATALALINRFTEANATWSRLWFLARPQ
jgi:hypothetical protein